MHDAQDSLFTFNDILTSPTYYPIFQSGLLFYLFVCLLCWVYGLGKDEGLFDSHILCRKESCLGSGVGKKEWASGDFVVDAI